MAANEVIVPLNPPRPRDRLERPLRDLRISVMDRCNFRCPYCMPREQFHDSYRFLKSSQRLSFEEILRLARLFVAQGVRKIRLTGGEPLLRANLADLIGDLTSIAGDRGCRADHQRHPARAPRGGAEGRGPESHHREPGQPGSGGLRAHERRLRRSQ